MSLVAVSCVQEMDAPVADGKVKFTASFDAAATKAVLKPGAEESKVEWEAGDRVSVLAADANYLYMAKTPGVTTTLVTDSTNVPSEDQFYAVYPYDVDAILEGRVITTELPAEQTGVLGSFSTHLAVAKAEGSNLAFSNVCGLVRVRVAAENVTKVVFEGNSGEVVAGAVNVTVAGAPEWTPVAQKGVTYVSLTAPSGNLAKGDYYFAVLPQTFEAGFKVTAYKGESASVIRNVSTEVTIARAGIVAGKAFGIDGMGTETEPYVLMTAQDIVDMRSLATAGQETWFKLGADVDMKGVSGYIPVNWDEDYERKIHFDGGNHTISNFSCDNTADGMSYPSLFGVLYGSCKNLKIDKAVIRGTRVCGVIGGYVGTSGKPGLVENVTVTNSSVSCTGNRSGGVCGVAKEATFRNVSFHGSMINTYTKAEAKSGGFLGQTESTVVCENCTADVVVNGASNDIGGFAGKLTGRVSFTGCSVKASITSSVVGKNRCGGFAGWNSSVEATFQNCHVLAGTTIAGEGVWTTAANGNFGGFIGYGDADGSVLTIKGCSASSEINAPQKSRYNGGFIGCTGSASTTTITDCHSEGSVCGERYVGGLIGAVQSDVTISKCWSSVTVMSVGQRVGGLVGTTTKPLVIRDSYSTGNVTSSAQQVAGILGYTSEKVTIERCYSTGDITSQTSGTGGIVGTISGAESLVSKCVAWNSAIVCNRNSDTKWAPGAIVGAADVAVTLRDCYRRNDMVLTDMAGAMTLYDQENITDDIPVWPSYALDATQSAYHGKAAAAGATVSSVARSLGWSESVWDFTGAFPVLVSGGTDGPDNEEVEDKYAVKYPAPGTKKVRTLQTTGYFTESAIRDGLIHYSFSGYEDITNAYQNVNVVEIDLDNPAYKINFHFTSRSTVSQVGNNTNSIVCVNAAYEQDAIYNRTNGENHSEVTILPDDPDADKARRFWKHEAAIVGDGERKLGIIHAAKGADNITDGGIQAIEVYKQLPEKNIFASAPMLIDDYDQVGTRFVPAAYDNFSISDFNIFNSEDYRRHQGVRHPRTAYAITEDNDLLLITVDGRYSGKAEGMSARELTRFIAKHFNPQWAINMDGGGSTTMFIKGASSQCGVDGVVNHPCNSGSTWSKASLRSLTTFLLVQSVD